MRILRYIFKLFILNLKKESFFRSSFIMDLIGNIFWVLIYFLFFKIIFSNVKSIGDWNESLIYILLGSSGIIFSLFSALCNYGAGSISSLVRNGTIEIFLLKPVPAPLFILFRFASISHLLSLIPPSIIFIYGVSNYGNFHILNFILYLISIFISFFIYSLLHLLFGLLAFKFVEVTPLFFILGDFADLGKYPYLIFPKALQLFFFYIIPILLITNFPVLVYTGKYYFLILQMLVLFILILLIYILFPIGRKIYQGTGTYKG